MDEKPPKGWMKKLAWAIAGSVLLLMAYLWGDAYGDLRIDGWGWGSYDPKPDPPDVYVQAFHAGFGFIRLPMDWFNTVPFWTALAVLLGVFLVGAGLGWLSLSRGLLAWRKRILAKLPLTMSARWHRAMTWGVSALGAVLFWPAVLTLLVAVLFLAIAPPYLAAKADAARAWKEEHYKKWDQATWTTDSGEKRQVWVHSCNEGFCAILDENRDPFTVSEERVGDRKGRSRMPVVKGAQP